MTLKKNLEIKKPMVICKILYFKFIFLLKYILLKPVTTVFLILLNNINIKIILIKQF